MNRCARFEERFQDNHEIQLHFDEPDAVDEILQQAVAPGHLGPGRLPGDLAKTWNTP